MELRDFIVRAIVVKNSTLHNIEVIEIPIDTGVVSENTIIDEMALFELLQEHVSSLGGKKQNVRFFVPDTSVLLKQIDHPDEVELKDLKSYVQMELGHTIHLPFQEPLFDVHDSVHDDGKATLFASPPEEVNKFINILLDLNFVPEVADIRALCNLRVLNEVDLIDESKTYLITDWSINNLVISIYSGGNVEFLRFQSIETDLSHWTNTLNENGELNFEYNRDIEQYKMLVTDQVLEIDRMMNFFRFSLHKGEKSVDEIVILGDNPLLSTINVLLKENFTLPIHTVNDALIESRFPGLKAKHCGLIGLALKEVKG